MNQRLMPLLVSSTVFVIIIFSIYVNVSSFIWPLEGSAKCQDTGPWGPKRSLIRVISFCFGVNKFLLRYNKDFLLIIALQYHCEVATSTATLHRIRSILGSLER